MNQVKHGLVMAGEHRVPDTGGSLRKLSRICLKFFPVKVVTVSYMDMYSCVVIYSENVCPPVKL